MTNFLKGMSGNQRTNVKTDEWLTPPEIVRALGPFDLDPCVPCSMAHEGKPWTTARTMYCLCRNGLELEWEGMVFVNPPYGTKIGRWVTKMARHNNGIVLAFARTEVGWFQDGVFDTALSLFFPMGRLRFYKPDGAPGGYTGGAPSVFAAYGKEADARLFELGRKALMRGKYVRINEILK